MTEKPSEDQVEEKAAERAKELAKGGEGHEDIEGDPDAAERAAESILEESEARKSDEAARDPEKDTVIRRSSDETA